MLWVELVFMMLVLKLPVIYVAWLVWWAIRAVPEPPEGAALPSRVDDPGPRGWWRRRLDRPGPRAPHGRRPARMRPARAGEARASAKVQR